MTPAAAPPPDFEAVAIVLCKSGKFETGQGTCAAVCMDQLGDPRKRNCPHAVEVHGKLAEAAWTAAQAAANAMLREALKECAKLIYAGNQDGIDHEAIARMAERRETIAEAIYKLDPFIESGEYVEQFQVSPGGALTWEQAKRRDAEFADDKIFLPITKFAYEAADAALAALTPSAAPGETERK